MVGFLSVLLLAEVGARAVEHQLPPPQRWASPFVDRKASRIGELGTVDIAVIGSSIANASVDVRLIEQELPWTTSAYNASNPGSAVREWLEWNRDLVMPELCPKVLVIAMGPRDTNENEPDDEEQLQRYLESDGRKELYGNLSLAESVEWLAEDLFALVALRERFREPDKVRRYLDGERVEGWWAPLSDNGRYEGFDDEPYEHTARRVQILLEGDMKDYEVGPVQFGALATIIEEARATGAYVVIVDMPLMRADMVEILPRGQDDYLAYDRSLKAVGDRTGVPVLTYRDLDDRPDLYADFYHMSKAGTDLVSTRIGQDLARLYPTPPADVSCAARPTDIAP